MLISFQQKLAEKFYHSAAQKSSDKLAIHKVYTFEFSTFIPKLINKFSTHVNNRFNTFNMC